MEQIRKIISLLSIVLAICSFNQVFGGVEIFSIDSSYKLTQDYLENVGKQIKQSGVITDELEREKLYVSAKELLAKANENIHNILKRLDKEAKPYHEESQRQLQALYKEINEYNKYLRSKDAQDKYDKFQESCLQYSKRIYQHAIEFSKDLSVEKANALAMNLFDQILTASVKFQGNVNEYIQPDTIKKRPKT